MRMSLLPIAIAGGALFTLSAAFADEVEIHRDHPPAVVVPAPVPDDHHDADIDHGGCESKTVHKENDAGESKTVHKEHCD